MRWVTTKIYRAYYWNKTESVSLRKCFTYWHTNKAYLSAIKVTSISHSFYLQDGGKKPTGIDMEQNYVTVTLVYLRSRGCQFRALLRNNSGQVVHTRAPVSNSINWQACIPHRRRLGRKHILQYMNFTRISSITSTPVSDRDKKTKNTDTHMYSHTYRQAYNFHTIKSSNSFIYRENNTRKQWNKKERFIKQSDCQ